MHRLQRSWGGHSSRRAGCQSVTAFRPQAGPRPWTLGHSHLHQVQRQRGSGPLRPAAGQCVRRDVQLRHHQVASAEPHTRSPHVPDPVQQLHRRHPNIQVSASEVRCGCARVCVCVAEHRLCFSPSLNQAWWNVAQRRRSGLTIAAEYVCRALS